jgi:hypothetical protein
LTSELSFSNTPAPISDGVLKITASGDFNHPAEELAVYVEGVFLGNLFGDTALDVLLTERGPF